MSKIILCGNENVLAVLAPSYEDGHIKPRIMLEVMALIPTDKTLSKAWKKIVESEDFKNNKMSFKQILDGLGKDFEDKVNERFLNMVIKKDMPYSVDTTAWSQERKNDFCKKYGFVQLPEHLMLPIDQIQGMQRDGMLGESDHAPVKHMVVDEKDHPEINKRGQYKAAYCFCQKKGYTVNMAKARIACQREIRRARKRAFVNLDWKVSSALARGDQAKALTHEQRREYWRNATVDSALEKAKTIQELEAFVTALPPE